MLKLTIPRLEGFNENTQEFVDEPEVELELEHSLAVLSKWESKYEKPFLGDTVKSDEEVLAYIEMMITTPDFPPEVLQRLTNTNMLDINAYINAKMSATWFSDPPNAKPAREVITSEVIYGWMVGFNIPFECENWHLSRLFTLLRVVSANNAPAKKKSTAQMAQERRELNAKRRAQYGTKG